MKKNGRPKNFETSEIKEILDEYVMFTQGTVILNASRVSEYAQNRKGLKDFKYYHIGRNKEAKAYMEELNSRIKENPAASRNKPIVTFEPIDIEKYLNKSKEQLGKSLQTLNVFMEKLTDNNTELVKQRDEYKKLLDKKAVEIVKLRERIRELENNQNKIVQAYEEREEKLKKRIKSIEKNTIDMEDIFKMKWDEEAESVLRELNIFENDGSPINDNRVITNLGNDLTEIKKEGKKLENDFKNKLKGLF